MTGNAPPSPTDPQNQPNPPADSPERDTALRQEVDRLKRDRKKAEPLWFKLLTPVAIALVGTIGSWVMYALQSEDMNIRLYSELMTKQEEGENTLRIEMFSRILESVLKSDVSDKETVKPADTSRRDENGRFSGRKGRTDDDAEDIDRIKNAVVQLELLGRNFHETIDMKPVFVSLKNDISEKLRPIRIKLMRELRKRERAAYKRDNSGFVDTIACLRERIRSFADDSGGALGAPCSALCPGCKEVELQTLVDSLRRERWKGFRRKMDSLWNEGRFARRHRGKDAQLMKRKDELMQCLDDLNDVAERIKRKQTDVLKGVGKEMRIRAEVPESNAIAQYWSDSEEDVDDTTGIAPCICSLTLEEEQYPRQFILHIKRINSNFSSVRVSVTSKYQISNSEDSASQWYDLYRSPDDYVKRDSLCEKCDTSQSRYYRCRIRRDSVYQEFTLEHYDFPLVDNIYLSKNERCALVLNGIDSVVDVSLLYFPARYAALKDKSFYNVQALENLTKKIKFLKEKK